MTTHVHYTSTWRKLWIIHERTKIGLKLQQNMYLNFGVAEEMIHYGLHHLRHDTEEGPFVLPKELRRRDPVKTLQDLFRRKMLTVDEEKLGPIKRKFHCPQVEFDLYWKGVYDSGHYSLTKFGNEVLQAVKEFFLADPHGWGTLPLYATGHQTLTPEMEQAIRDACAHWGMTCKFTPGAPEGKSGLCGVHVWIYPDQGTWWLRQFHRFEDRLEKFIPLEQFEDAGRAAMTIHLPEA